MSKIGDLLGDVVGGVTGAKQQGEAAERAGEIQAQSSEAGIEESRRQFDALVELMSPFVETGTQAIGAQSDLIGLGGADAQAAAIQQLEQSPQFQTVLGSAEEGILQNASATGGLRGGNTQRSLATLRPELLTQMINQQYGRLGGLSQLGQASAAGQASAGIQTGSNIANLLGQAGAARASGTLGQGSVVRQTFGDALNIAQIAAKAGAF